MDFLKKVTSEAINEAVTSNNNSNSNNDYDDKDNKNDNSHKSNNNNHTDNDDQPEGNSNSNNSNNSSAEDQVASAVMGKINNVFGGGEMGEQKEEVLDKAIDLFQEHVLKVGSQSDESAVEQAKDAQIASAIRSGYKTATGKDFPDV